MKVFDETNIGKRTSNQDKVAIVNTRGGQLLALVCDGMGGITLVNWLPRLFVNTSWIVLR